MRTREFVERASRRLADDGRHQRERASVVVKLLSCRGSHRKTEHVATLICRHVHACFVVGKISSGRSRLDPIEAHRHIECMQQQDAILLRSAQIRQLGEKAEDRFVDAADQPLIDRDPDSERGNALGHRLEVMQGVGVERDVRHSAPENDTRWTSSSPLKYRSNTSCPPRATTTEWMLAPDATSLSVASHNAGLSISFAPSPETTAQPSSLMLGTPQASGGSEYAGTPARDASAVPPSSEENRDASSGSGCEGCAHAGDELPARERTHGLPPAAECRGQILSRGQVMRKLVST